MPGSSSHQNNSLEIHQSHHLPGAEIRPHRHREAYAALVLKGNYRESGGDGAWQVSSGELVIHPAYHLHTNRIGKSGARVLNVTLPAGCHGSLDSSRYGVYRLNDPGRIERLLRKSPVEALEEAGEAIGNQPELDENTWLDQLATRLDPLSDRCPIACLARENRISPEHFSRQFCRHFGIPPSAFRREARLRHALQSLAATGMSLCDIAVESGYSDQSHMSRELKRLTGRTPRQLRMAQ